MKKPSIIFITGIFTFCVITACSVENIDTVNDDNIDTGLQNGSILEFTPYTGSTTNAIPEIGEGSWFSMEVSSGATLITPVTSLNGLILGSIQLANTITPATGNIDQPWTAFGNPGAHQTVNNLNLVTTTNNSATIDFSGWGVTWNSIPNIDMSKNSWNGNADGIATLTCNKDCKDGDSYILDYSATLSATAPSGYSKVKYSLHLEGTIHNN